MRELFLVNAAIALIALLAGLVWGAQGVVAMLRNRGGKRERRKEAAVR